MRNNGFNGHSLRECALAVAQVWERETSPEDSRVKFIMVRLIECPEALISIVEPDPVYTDQLNSLEEES